jgi:hypothetical protein
MTRPTITRTILILALALVPSSRALATTLSEVLDGIDALRRPPSLDSLSFTGEVVIDLEDSSSGLLPENATFQGAWRTPDEWFCVWELSGETAEAVENVNWGHPALDHVLLSRPDFLQSLYREWTAQYQGTALWSGDPAWQLVFRPTDLANRMPGFNLIVRKDDFVPVRASVTFPDGAIATTDLEWVNLEGVLLPSRFTTRLDQPLGPLRGFETTFFNHEINPDLSGIEFPRREGTLNTSEDVDAEEGPPVFEELYHGFADDPIVAPINDSSGTYTSIEFTFSLYVEDREIFSELDRRKDEISKLAIDVVSGREWTGKGGLSDPAGKYECGEAIRKAICELLETEAVTDFYFLEFEPMEGE